MGKVGIGEIEAIRQQLHSIIDNQIDNFIKQHKADIAGVSEADIEDESIRYNLLKSKTSIFKGTKPISVTFSDGRTEHTNTWKKVVTAILVDCNSDKAMHKNLIYLRGRVFGNFCSILSNKSNSLKAPIKIDDGLYFETRYDTETLLYVLKKRVLDVVGYDYSTIVIQHKIK